MLDKVTLLFLIRLRMLREHARDRGVTAVEYGLLVALVVVMIVAGIALLGPGITDVFTDANNEMQNGSP